MTHHRLSSHPPTHPPPPPILLSPVTTQVPFLRTMAGVARLLPYLDMAAQDEWGETSAAAAAEGTTEETTQQQG